MSRQMETICSWWFLWHSARPSRSKLFHAQIDLQKGNLQNIVPKSIALHIFIGHAGNKRNLNVVH